MINLKEKFRGKNLSTYWQVIVSVILVVAVFSMGVYIGKGRSVSNVAIQNGNNDISEKADFGPFWQAWQVLNEKFVPSSTSTETVTDKDKVWGAIEGLAASYKDPYTVFFPPVESKMFEEEISGSFSGVGMEIASQGGILTVVSPLKGTPAYRADVRAGDKIVQIEDKSAAKMPVDEAISLIRGESGTKVKITFARDGNKELLVKELTRESIAIPTLDSKMLPGNIYLIQLYSFSQNSPELFRRALREFVESGSDKLILDLRNNPGGYLNAAVSMASWFLPAGKLVVSEDFGGKRESVEHRSYGYDIFNDNLKLVILVNNGSASASEILAGALKEQGKAILIGENTFGKGSVQELVPLTSDTSLKVTIAHWLTPNGNSISNGGLRPDIQVKPTAKDIETGKDPVLEKAIEYLKK